MPSKWRPSPPGGWQAQGEWWAGPGHGAEAWEGFGRRMFLRGLLFFALFIVLVAALIVTVVGVISDVGGWQAVVLVLATPFVLMLLGGLLGRSFIRSWRPVRRLIKAAGDLADGDYTVRVKPSGSRSIRAVVSSFNDMAGRLESSDEQRRRLLADLGHELRTPLTVVRGEIEAMVDGVHQPDQDHLEILLGEVRVMERLLDDLRTLSLLDAGVLELHPEPTDLGVLVEDVADAHRRRAAERGVSVEVELHPEVGEVSVDPVRMREVLSNLAVNALRAMPDGGQLVFRVAGDGDRVVVDVSDTGTGIEPDELSQVFDRFHKGSTSRGSGLGLTISRDLMRAHGGRISIDSRPGLGTRARLELPAP